MTPPYEDVHLKWSRGDDGIMFAGISGWNYSSCCRYTVESEPWNAVSGMTTWRGYEQRGGRPKKEVFLCHSSGDGEAYAIEHVEKYLTAQRRKWAWDLYMLTHWPPESDE